MKNKINFYEGKKIIEKDFKTIIDTVNNQIDYLDKLFTPHYDSEKSYILDGLKIIYYIDNGNQFLKITKGKIAFYDYINTKKHIELEMPNDVILSIGETKNHDINNVDMVDGISKFPKLILITIVSYDENFNNIRNLKEKNLYDFKNKSNKKICSLRLHYNKDRRFSYIYLYPHINNKIIINNENKKIVCILPIGLIDNIDRNYKIKKIVLIYTRFRYFLYGITPNMVVNNTAVTIPNNRQEYSYIDNTILLNQINAGLKYLEIQKENMNKLLYDILEYIIKSTVNNNYVKFLKEYGLSIYNDRYEK